MSLTNVFYIKEKDCSKGVKKVSGPFGNMFALGPYEPDRSLLMTESVFLKESDDYVMSIEIQNNNVYKEIFIHNWDL